MATEEQKAAFRRRLRQEREAARHTQMGLSLKIGVSRSAVWQWEEGKSVPTEANVAALENLEFRTDELAEINAYATESGINLWAASSRA